jgi:tetratricopeptide (TPR) repeat protein
MTRSALALLLLLVAGGCTGAQRPGAPPQPTLDDVEPAVAEAVRAAREAVLAAPESAETWGGLGDRLAAHGWGAEALACYAAAEHLEPRTFVWPYMQGHLLVADELDAALAAFDRALALDGEYAPAHYFRARVLHRLGRPAEAADAYRRATSLNERLSQAWLGLGQLELQRGEVAAARVPLERALALEPRDPATHHALAQVAAALGEADAAATHAAGAARLGDRSTPIDDPRRRTAVEPIGHAALNRRGLDLLAAGRPEEAVTWFRRAIAADPGRAPARYNLGRAEQARGRPAAAIEAARAALRIDPAYVEAHYLLGTVLAMSNRPDEALTHLETTLQAWPGFAPAHVNLGGALQSLGRLEEAVEHFRAALEAAPQDVGACYNLGSALARQGRHDEALTWLRRAAELAPSDARVRRRLEELSRQGRR